MAPYVPVYSAFHYFTTTCISIIFSCRCYCVCSVYLTFPFHQLFWQVEIIVDKLTLHLFALDLGGWIAQWKELIADPEQKIGRPRQLFTGAKRREFVPVGKR